jgi:hypothetical protein
VPEIDRQQAEGPRVAFRGTGGDMNTGGNMKRMLRTAAAFFVSLVLSTLVALAQGPTATILGIIKDRTQSVLPGVTITVTNQETSITRTVVSDEQGRYVVPGLIVGVYQVQADLPGFQSAIRRDITLTIGREAVVDLFLDVGEIAQEVTVQGDAPMVNVTSGGLGNVVEQAELATIPLQGRNLAQVPLLEAGVQQVRTAGESERKITAVGARPTMNVYLLDGVNIQGFDEGSPTGSSGVMLGLEGVREMKVSTSAYSAEFGRGGGAIFQVATKSGTNTIHGSVYEYYRNAKMDAANFFAVGGKDPFRRHQFGGSLGGPIVRNRNFFFTSYEALRERLGITGITGTLTADAREGRVRNAATGQVTAFTVNPKVAPYVPLYPSPNGPILDRGNGIGDYSFKYTRPTDDHHFQARADHQFSQNDSLYGRYTLVDSSRSTVGPAPAFGGMGTDEGMTNQYAVLDYQRIFNSAFLNTIRFGFSRDTPFTDTLFETSIPNELFLVPGQSVPGSISVSGLGGLGEAVSRRERYVNRFQFMDNATVQRGAHSLRFGVLLERMHFDADFPGRDGGDYSFGSLISFLRDASPSRFRGSIKPGSNDPVRFMRQTFFGTYVQDDVRVTSRLTLNLGLRWEFTTVPTETHGRISNLRGDLPFLQAATLDDLSLGDPWFKLSKKNIEPRLGFAWNVFGDLRTALKGGFGIFHNQIGPWLYRTAVFRAPPFLSELETRDPRMPFPNMYDLCIANDPLCIATDTVDLPAWEMETPYIRQYNLAIEHELLPQMTVGVAYAGSRGVDLGAFADVNTPPATLIDGRLVYPAALTGRPNPNYDYMRQRFSGTHSWYDSVELRVNRRLEDGLQFRAAYTFSKFLDEQPGNQSASDTDVGGGDLYVYDHSLSKGLTNFHAAHKFSLNFAYDLPFGRARRWGAEWSPWLEGLLGGWQLSGLVTAVSGNAGTVTVAETLGFLGVAYTNADLVPGGNSNPTLGEPSKYFDTSQFLMPPPRTLGNLGRGTLIGPGVSTVDLAVGKSFPVGLISDGSRLEFRVEAYNAFNHPNFAFPSLTVFDNQGRPNPSAGRVTSTVTAARQLQLSARLEW